MLHDSLLNRNQTPDNCSEFDMGLWSKVQMLHRMEGKGKGGALKVKGLVKVSLCVCARPCAMYLCMCASVPFV